MARVGLIFGGRSVEHEVSMVSARTVAAGLSEAGHEVVPLGVAPDGCWLDLESSASALAGEMDALPAVGGAIAATLEHLLAAHVEVVFPIIHGTWGEDGALQGLCEILDLPYVGAGVATSAVAMDKRLAKGLFAAAGVPTVDYEAVTAAELADDRGRVVARCERLGRPVFVKPSNGGSSVGVARVEAAVDLAAAIEFALRFDDSALVERAITGRELECSVLGYGQLVASAIGEIVPGSEFYDYADKYLEDAAELRAPTDLPPEAAQALQATAVQAFAALGGWGMARVDFLWEGADRFWVNEVNTLPGFTRISMYPKLWEVSGLPLPRLVDRLVEIAFERHRDRRSLDEGIKEWLAKLERR